MHDKRKLKRRQLGVNLEMIDINTRQPLGRIVDLTTEGLMMVSSKPLDPGTFVQVRISLPEPVVGKKHLDLDMESVWGRRDINPDLHITGFQFLDPREESLQAIVGLMVKYGEPE
jgi:hypothetical protein